MLRKLVDFKSWGPLGISSLTVQDCCPCDHIIEAPPKPGFVRVRLRVPYRARYDFRREEIVDEEHYPLDPYGQFDCARFIRGDHILHDMDFELDHNGGLDLRRVGHRRGIEKFIVIDVERKEELKLQDPYWLSPIAIKILSEPYGYVTLTEYLNVMTRKRKALRTELRYFIEDLKTRMLFMRLLFFLCLLIICCSVMALLFYMQLHPQTPNHAHPVLLSAYHIVGALDSRLLSFERGLKGIWRNYSYMSL